jgi:thiamine biosynthesis lipoprotein
MSARFGRRRLLISASAGGLALLAGDVGATRAPTWRWQGSALGAESTMLLAHPDRAAAGQAIAACRAEIARLERIFSLYRADSALSQLNRQGWLEAPPLELVELLAFAARVSAVTGGAFDVTVQPLWELYAGHFADAAADPDGPNAAELAATLVRVDWRAVALDPARIGFRLPGMAVTLNGVAQGYITDRVADLLRGHGFENVLVELGEVRALGRRPESEPWRAGIAAPNDPSGVLLELPLLDTALATSGGYGTWFDPAHRHHHLLDPATGRSAAHHAAVSVTAPRAMVADALSTALTILPAAAARRSLATFGPATAYLFARGGGQSTVVG